MKLEEIKHPEFKNLINLAYMQGENGNEEAILNEYIVPIFTDEREYILGMQYFSLNVMDDNKEYIIEKLDYFKKLKEDPKFLGYLVNISSVSYIINTSLL